MVEKKTTAAAKPAKPAAAKPAKSAAAKPAKSAASKPAKSAAAKPAKPVAAKPGSTEKKPMGKRVASIKRAAAARKAPFVQRIPYEMKSRKAQKALKARKKQVAEKLYKKKTPGKPTKGMVRPKKLFSGKFTIPNTIKKPRTLLLSNLEKTVTPKEIREMFKYFLAHIKSVRMVMTTKGLGEEALRDEAGKLIPQKTGNALVTFRSTEARKRVQRRKFNIAGRAVKVTLAPPNRKHLRRMRKQVLVKKNNLAKLKEAKKEIKEQMYKNLLKNQKKSAYKKREAAKKKGVNRTPKENEKKKTVLRQRHPKQERRALSGFKAVKARPRMTRK